MKSFGNHGATAYLFTVGFISILGQVVILRELTVAFYGIELIYILAMGFWLFGTAIGAALGRRSRLPKERHIRVLLPATAVVLLADVGLIRGIRIVLGAVPGGYLPFTEQLFGLAVALVPISVAAGLLFQWSAKLYVTADRTLAGAYAVESAGGVLGGLSSTLFLSIGLQNFAAAVICSGAAVAVVALHVARSKGIKPREARRHRVLEYSLYAGLAGILMLLVASRQLDRWMTSWDHPHLVEAGDTPYNRITVTSQEGQVCVFEDGALSYETQGIAAEEFVQLSTLQSVRPQKVLLLGGGFEGILLETLKLPVERIDYVEINKGMLKSVAAHLPDELTNSLNDRRVNIVYADPRQFLHRAKSYDMILAAMPEPMSAQNNRFYTREFFEECSARMAEGGVFAFEIRSAENLWTPQMEARNSSIYSALKSVFKNIVVLPGVTNIFIASSSPLTTEPAILTERFEERDLHTRLVSPQYIKYLYTNDRFAGISELLSTRLASANSDLHPACYGYAMSLWLSKFFPGFTLPVPQPLTLTGLVNSIPFWIAVGVLLLAGRTAGARRFILVMLAGLVGMVMETLLMLNYQSKSGVLYQDIGILLMSFMIGLTLGAFLVDRYVRPKALIKQTGPGHGSFAGLAGLGLFVGFALLNAVTYYLFKSEYLNSLYSTSLLLILDGAFVSAIFALVALRETEDGKAIPIRLYSADLIGGSIGSLAASLYLIPIYGILPTAIMMAGAAMCGMVFLK